MNEKKWTDTLIKDIVSNITDSEHMIVPIIGTGVYHAIENDTVFNIQEFIVKKILEDDDEVNPESWTQLKGSNETYF